jgi:phosphoglycolate phosphatase-like HAD superfamily hydrolase
MIPTSLVFDFDGVLADTYEHYVNYLAKTFRRKESWAEKQVLKSSLEHTTKNFIYRFLSHFYFRRFGHYLAKQTGLVFEDRLLEIEQIDLPKAVLSRSTRKICRNLLGEQADLFEEISGRNQAKNKIEGLNKICENNPKFDRESLLFFTDTVADILEMKKVLRDDQIFAVAWGRFNKKELLLKHLPETQILQNSFQECSALSDHLQKASS